MSRNSRGGQAVILVVVATSFFIFGALGLAIDGAHLFAQSQMAQVAADAAAQAGVMTIFDGTDSVAPTANRWVSSLSSGPIYCNGASDGRTPCAYASRNGFTGEGAAYTVGGSVKSQVKIEAVPNNSPILAGVAISGGNALTSAGNALQVTVVRTVNTTLMRFLGTSASVIRAKGVAAIVDANSPVPILVTHPTLRDAFALSGTGAVAKITVVGGPGRSIQVDSNNQTSAVSANGNPVIDLRKAGPDNTGADFGTFGGPSTAPFVSNELGTGKYVQPSSPIDDPLASILPPANPNPGASSNPATTTALLGVNGCPVASCTVFYPGTYPNAIDIKNMTALFTPGVYYLTGGGFHANANGQASMANGPVDPTTGTGMLIYDTGPLSGGHANSGGFSVAANAGNINLAGSGCSFSTKTCDSTNYYKGILFYEDHNAKAQTHSFSGGGGMTLVGTLYMTNTKASMLADPSTYQTLDFQGNPSSGTQIYGEIIASALTLSGNPQITMNLFPSSFYTVRQVALVK